MGHCRAASPSPTASRRGASLPPTLSSIFFSSILREAKEDPPDGINTRVKTDSNVYNLRRLLARTKAIEEHTNELLFSDCALLGHTEEAVQHSVNRFSDAAKNFCLTTSMKKTEALYIFLYVFLFREYTLQ